VHRARVGQQPDDGAENLLEVERRPDRRDDGVEDPALADVGGRRADADIVSRKRLLGAPDAPSMDTAGV
jgi:hypothetical protein